MLPLALCAAVQVQSPREQLQELVVQLQKAPPCAYDSGSIGRFVLRKNPEGHRFRFTNASGLDSSFAMNGRSHE